MTRVQRRRTRGWRMPPDAVFVGRPSRWGNPVRVGQPIAERDRHGWWPPLPEVADARAAALRYGDVLRARLRDDPGFVEPLRGRVLACWCPTGPGTWCHADRILEWFEAHPLLVDPSSARPVFGLHRMDPREAATAPASRIVTEAEREARYRRELLAWARREGVPLPVPEEARP